MYLNKQSYNKYVNDDDNIEQELKIDEETFFKIVLVHLIPGYLIPINYGGKN